MPVDLQWTLGLVVLGKSTNRRHQHGTRPPKSKGFHISPCEFIALFMTVTLLVELPLAVRSCWGLIHLSYVVVLGMGCSLVEHLAPMRLEGCLDHLILPRVRQGVQASTSLSNSEFEMLIIWGWLSNEDWSCIIMHVLSQLSFFDQLGRAKNSNMPTELELSSKGAACQHGSTWFKEVGELRSTVNTLSLWYLAPRLFCYCCWSTLPLVF